MYDLVQFVLSMIPAYLGAYYMVRDHQEAKKKAKQKPSQNFGERRDGSNKTH